MGFNLDQFVTSLREAASAPGAPKAVLALMRDAVADPEVLARDLPSFEEDDVVLFEDDSVSIWHVRFQPHVMVPPHDHQMEAFIGVYEGVEENCLYRKEDDGLEMIKRKRVVPGDLMSIGPAGIHSVMAEGDKPSCAIHAYLGKLTTVERSLFDWDSGAAIPFTDDNYDSLQRVV